jgi:hypothetical protein
MSQNRRPAVAGPIKVNAPPLAVDEWTRLLAEHGLVAHRASTASMALYNPDG